MSLSARGPGEYEKLLRSSPMADASAPSPAELRRRYEILLDHGQDDSINAESNLEKLKELILAFGIPDDDTNVNLTESCKLRGKVWQLLLGMRSVNIEEYLALLSDGIPEVRNEAPPDNGSTFGSQSTSSKDIIVVDADRTFKMDVEFSKKVPFEKIVRVLSAFHRKIQKSSKYMGYIQGMNCVAGCFLYTMPEAEAWAAMCIMMEQMCPRYCGLHNGSSDGDVLVRRIVESVDPILYKKIQHLSLNIFTHQVLHGLCTVYPPLTEVLKLWDLMLAFGVHMSTIFTACMIILRRDEILAMKDPAFFLQKGNQRPTDASALIRLATHIIPLLPPRLYALCAVHPFKQLSVISEMEDPFAAL